jgi:hypothetical protein
MNFYWWVELGKFIKIKIYFTVWPLAKFGSFPLVDDYQFSYLQIFK